jgi:hypothetical protein
MHEGHLIITYEHGGTAVPFAGVAIDHGGLQEVHHIHRGLSEPYSLGCLPHDEDAVEPNLQGHHVALGQWRQLADL